MARPSRRRTGNVDNIVGMVPEMIDRTMASPFDRQPFVRQPTNPSRWAAPYPPLTRHANPN
jgi:hypothetical protein